MMSKLSIFRAMYQRFYEFTRFLDNLGVAWGFYPSEERESLKDYYVWVGKHGVNGNHYGVGEIDSMSDEEFTYLTLELTFTHE
jgi:hypothetical protein